MNHIVRLERKYIPNVRKKKWYKITKALLFLPLGIIVYSVTKLAKKIRFKRKNKPDIVLTNIIAGFGNLAFKNKNVELLAMSRAQICAGCPFAEKSGVYSIIKDNRTEQIQGMKCGKCGCNLSAKVRSIDDYCPEGKW